MTRLLAACGAIAAAIALAAAPAAANWPVPPTTTTTNSYGQSFDPNGGLLIGGCDHTGTINIGTATTTVLLPKGAGALQSYICSFFIMAGGADNVTFEAGTGTTCGTGTGTFTGPLPLTAQTGVSYGTGFWPIIMIPSGQDFCLLTSAAVQLSGMFTWAYR